MTGLAFALLSSVAAAQSNLGELLDAGARRLSAEEFRAEVVQRTFVGPTATGGSLEVFYTTSGTIQGVGTHGIMTASPARLLAQVNGDWKIDDADRVCTALRITTPGGGSPNVVLPSRCQYWFKLGDVYFLSDSDTDRRTKVLRRALKP
jgi:hypothetical protein